MKDEIKEMLEHIEILDNTDYILHSDKAKALLDYITNLRTIEQQYDFILSENVELENKIINLQEQLEDKAYEQLKTQCFIYKSKIDKAIEYIEKQSKFIEGCDVYKICNKDILLNILQNGGNNER